MSRFVSVQFCRLLRASTELAPMQLICNVKASQYFSSCNVCNSLISAAFFISLWHCLLSYASCYRNTISVTRSLSCVHRVLWEDDLYFCDLDTHYEMAVNIRVREWSANPSTGILSASVSEPSGAFMRVSLEPNGKVWEATKGNLTFRTKGSLCAMDKSPSSPTLSTPSQY